jgi:Tfp pilus assembly protein PilV
MKQRINKLINKQNRKKHVPCSMFHVPSHRAFSFIEVILSVFLVGVGIVAAVNLIASGIGQTLDSKNQQVAAGLAQEGIELVRNVRDNNWAAGNKTFASANFPDCGPQGCRIDYTYTTINSGGTMKLMTENGTGFYVHPPAGPDTKFGRKIIITYYKADGSTVTNQANAVSAKVTSEVIWDGSCISDTGCSFPAITDCNTGNKCAYAQVTLTQWGGN